MAGSSGALGHGGRERQPGAVALVGWARAVSRARSAVALAGGRDGAWRPCSAVGGAGYRAQLREKSLLWFHRSRNGDARGCRYLSWKRRCGGVLFPFIGHCPHRHLRPKVLICGPLSSGFLAVPAWLLGPFLWVKPEEEIRIGGNPMVGLGRPRRRRRSRAPLFFLETSVYICSSAPLPYLSGENPNSGGQRRRP